MSDNAGVFKCQGCGRCCRALVTEDMGVFRGLTLLPGETRRFPKEQVKPAIGLGEEPSMEGFKVVAYQLTANECPHLKEKRCVIYEDRPFSCKQFPFSLEPSEDGGALLGVDMNCPSATKLVESQAKFVFSDQAAAERLLEVKKMVASNPGKAWFYDLAEKKWVKMNS
ncbi:MAG: YkgJ family cysteine cluster protein [Candidatus Bathyarchaeota archaeon]|nr:YkgJ family cysteine cluster protein [Candidatus Bathyarchaeota archaeon]